MQREFVSLTSKDHWQDGSKTASKHGYRHCEYIFFEPLALGNDKPVTSMKLLCNEQKSWTRHSLLAEVRRCIEQITNYFGKVGRREVDVLPYPILSHVC